MADFEIRIEDPQEVWDALYARIEALADADTGPEASSDAGPRAHSAPDDVFLALWGFV